jgi:membrane fusion protein, copper/silver efflux system
MKNLNRIAVAALVIGACGLGMTACETEHEHHSASMEHTAQYTCSMHPEVVQNSPGKCPKCGMELVAKK